MTNQKKSGVIVGSIKDLIKHRYLLWDLAIKDIMVRYRTPSLGFLWAIILPLVMALIYKLVFSTILKTRVENYPFFIYLMTAIFPWIYFSSSIGCATESILSNRNLIKKIYFPRHIIPISIVLSNLINFIPTLLVMLLIMLFFRVEFTILILLLPFILLLQTMLTIGVALIVSSVQTIFCDSKYIVELLIMAWLFLSPGFYSLAMVANVSDRFFRFYILNPFVGLFSLYRIAFFKGFAKTLTLPRGVNIYMLSAWTVAVCVAVFLLGFLVFKKYESRFSDLI